MDALPFSEEEFDVIWSEGAVYNMGFEAGIEAWRPFLKPGGKLIVSEITWLSATRPPELQAFWDEAYPEINVASAKIERLEQHGYCPLGYFTLPEHCWIDNYYLPIQRRLEALLEKHEHTDEIKAFVESERQEIALYEKHKAYYSYGVYIAQKGIE